MALGSPVVARRCRGRASLELERRETKAGDARSPRQAWFVVTTRPAASAPGRPLDAGRRREAVTAAAGGQVGNRSLRRGYRVFQK